MGDTVRYECVDHVATITYHRPEALNAINAELRRDLNAAWERFRADEDAWVGIVTGAGRAFCVGADLKDGRGSVGEWPGTFWEIPTINSFESGLEIWKPTIAAVPGYCLGYGLTAVLRCDFVVAADDAEFGFPEVGLGVPTIVGAMRLPGRIGWSNAMELLLTGDAAYSIRTIDEDLVPTFCDDIHDYKRSLGEIRRFREHTDAITICGHDAASWPGLAPLYA